MPTFRARDKGRVFVSFSLRFIEILCLIDIVEAGSVEKRLLMWI